MTAAFAMLLMPASLSMNDEGVHLGLARPIPPWAFALFCVLVIVLSAWSYRGLVGSRWVRVLLACVRALILLVLGVLALGPSLIQTHERIERDWTIMLVDRSASLGVPDAQDASGARMTRDEQLRRALRDAWPTLREMDARRQVQWLGFGSGIFDLARTPDGMPDLAEANQQATAIGTAIDQALRQSAGRIVSALVLLSDGRSSDDLPQRAVARIQNDRIRVITVPLGSPTPMADLALTRVEAPLEAFVHDPVRVTVRVERRGTGPAPTAHIELVDERTGQILDRQTVEGSEREEIVLRTRPETPEEARWLVRLSPDTPDLVDENNQQPVRINLVDRPLRVAYFDGYPRWEYRYVKNLLLREGSINSSAMLLATNRRYLQEGNELLTRVPSSPEEWAPFDVIILGDVRPGVFSPSQLEQIRDHVAQRGAGLVWIAGSGATPNQWRGTPLEDLLPVRLEETRPIEAWDEAVTLFATPASERLGVLRLAGADESAFPTRLSDPRTGWSRLWFCQRIDPDRVKPSTETLALAAPADRVLDRLASQGASALDVPPPEATPAVLTMRYGAGRVIYVATDETWRWRFGRGEALQERFWIPLVRLPGRDSLGRSGQAAMLEAQPTQALVDQPVRISLRLLDQRLIDVSGESVRVRARDPRDPSDPGVTITLQGQPAETAGVRTYEGVWSFAASGQVLLEAIEPWLGAQKIATTLRVLREDSEMLHPEADHEFLASIRERSVKPGLASNDIPPIDLAPEDLSRLPGLIPVRDIRSEAPPTIEPLWDRWMVLLVLIGLLTLEWVGRKLVTLA